MMLKRKILMVSYAFPPLFGGASIQAIRLSRELQKKNVYVEFISDNGSEPTVREVREQIVVNRVQTFSGQKWACKVRETVFIFKILWFVILHPEFRIVHFHSMRGLEAILYPILRAMGRKSVLKLTLAGNDDPFTMKKRKCLGWFYFWGMGFVDHMVAISRRLVNLAIEANLKNVEVSLIFNGIDSDEFVPADPEVKNEMRRRIGINENKKMFISVGKIERRKGYDLLLECYKEIAGLTDDSSLIIVGPGNSVDNPYYGLLQKYVLENNLKSVQFLGAQKDVSAYLKAADCFLFCSREEGFGTVLIEAMACGLPTVAMNIPDITEDIITDSDIGRICYSNDPREFSKQVVELIHTTNPGQLSLASHRIRDRFSIGRIADQYIEVYDSLLNGKRN